MAPVKMNVPVNEGVIVGIDRELDYLMLVVGDWLVELVDGKLIVRNNMANFEVLRVDA